jgi:hypothetical protein
MAFTKFASVEITDILDTKGSATQAKTASLSRLSEFNDYRTEDGFLYARIRAISSRVNKNHDGWPSIELAGNPDIFERYKQSGVEGGFTVEAKKGDEYGFSTFLGKPIFVDHNNSDPSRARGVIVDAKLHVEDHKTAAELDPYYASAPENHTPPTWVELLLEVDAQSFPKLAKAIIEGSKDPSKGIDGFSMGCDVDYTVCNICKNAAYSPDEFCQHVKMKGAEFDHYDDMGRRASKKAYEDCYGIKFFEISAVFDPADETALIREVKTAKTADWGDLARSEYVAPDETVDCPHCGDKQHDDHIHRDVHGDVVEIECPNCGPVDMDPVDVGPDREDVLEHEEAYWHSKTANTKTADNPPPQMDMERLPREVNTLRHESICDVCGSNKDDKDDPCPVCGSLPESAQEKSTDECSVCGSPMHGEQTCKVCGNTEPPQGFNNPDLSRAMELREEVTLEDVTGEEPFNSRTVASINNDMAWKVEVDPRVAGEINNGEQPILNPNGLGTNEPVDETTISDQTTPVTSSVLTAKDFIESVERNQAGDNMEKVADEVSKDNASASKADVETHVEGVGAVYEGTNEESSKADAQTAVDAKGTHPAWGDDPAERMDVEHEGGDIEAIPTKTFPNKNQHDPVSSEPFPASEEGVKKSHDDSAFPTDDGGLAGGNAKSGTEPADPMGKAQDRVDVLDHVTSPNNNSGPTKTWTGTDGNGVTKQQPAVTKEPSPPADEGVKKSTHLLSAFKLADLEVELGLLDADRKYARVAELENESPEAVKASLRYAERVRLAGLGRQAKTAKRLPSMTRSASTDKSPTEKPESDSSLFM